MIRVAGERSKTVGTIEIQLWTSTTRGKWAVSTEGWCSGLMSREKAEALYESLDTVSRVVDEISDAYNRASGQEC